MRCQVTRLFMKWYVRHDTSYFQQIKCQTIGMLDKWAVLPQIVKALPLLLLQFYFNFPKTYNFNNTYLEIPFK